jgi:hypothetical protein
VEFYFFIHLYPEYFSFPSAVALIHLYLEGFIKTGAAAMVIHFSPLKQNPYPFTVTIRAGERTANALNGYGFDILNVLRLIAYIRAPLRAVGRAMAHDAVLAGSAYNVTAKILYTYTHRIH